MDMFEQLLTSSSTPKVGAEMLEMIGRKAADRFIQKGVPLNQAIVQLAADHPELGSEHLKRIVEFANTVAFQEMHSKDENKNVHFDVADPAVVLRDLKDGGSPAHDGKTMHSANNDYAGAPSSSASSEGSIGDLQALFNSGSPGSDADGGMSEKNASADRVYVSHHANPIDDVYDLHVKLSASQRELRSAYEQWDLMGKQASAELFAAVKTEILSPNGAGIGGVVDVLSKIASSRQAVFKVLAPMIESIVEDHGVSAEKLAASLEKTAGRLINPNHPLVRSWTGLAKVAENKAITAEALREVNEGLSETSFFLRNQAK